MNPFFAQLIAQILALVGPWLTDAIKKWLDGLFTKVAPTTGTAATLADPMVDFGVGGPNKSAAAAELIDAALKAVKGVRPFKRATLHVMARTVPAAIARGDKKLKAADGGSELKAVGGKADSE